MRDKVSYIFMNKHDVHIWSHEHTVNFTVDLYELDSNIRTKKGTMSKCNIQVHTLQTQ